MSHLLSVLRSIENLSKPYKEEILPIKKEKSDAELVDELLKELDFDNDDDDDNNDKKQTKKTNTSPSKADVLVDPASLPNKLVAISQPSKQTNDYVFNVDLEKELNLALAMDEERFLQEIEEEEQVSKTLIILAY